MKRACSFMSIIMLVTLALTQLIQAAHRHCETYHYAKHSESSSHEDLQLADAKCFVCTFHSNSGANPALLPAEFKLATFVADPILLEARPGIICQSRYAGTTFNRGPPCLSLL